MGMRRNEDYNTDDVMPELLEGEDFEEADSDAGDDDDTVSLRLLFDETSLTYGTDNLRLLFDEASLTYGEMPGLPAPCRFPYPHAPSVDCRGNAQVADELPIIIEGTSSSFRLKLAPSEEKLSSDTASTSNWQIWNQMHSCRPTCSKAYTGVAAAPFGAPTLLTLLGFAPKYDPVLPDEETAPLQLPPGRPVASRECPKLIS
jgi:hypothetical protein